MYLSRVNFFLFFLKILIIFSTDILMLDDPLSALDMHVADNIMREGICGDLKHKTSYSDERDSTFEVC